MFLDWLIFSFRYTRLREFHTLIPTSVATSTRTSCAASPAVVAPAREAAACSSAHQTDQEIPFRLSSGIVQPSAAATPSARTSPEFQAVIVQTQFLYACIKDCVWTSLLGMNVNVGGRGWWKLVTMFDVPFVPYLVFRKWLCSARLDRVGGVYVKLVFVIKLPKAWSNPEGTLLDWEGVSCLSNLKNYLKIVM